MPVPGPTMMTGAVRSEGRWKPDERTKTHALIPGANAPSCVEQIPSFVRPSAAPRIGSRKTLTVRWTVLLSASGEEEIV